MIQSDYLTRATLGTTAPDDDFRSVLEDGDESRIHEALSSRFTQALFNGAVGARLFQQVDNLFPQLEAALDQSSQLDRWVIQGEGEIALDQTLGLIRMELLQSVVHCTEDRALARLDDALKTGDDTMHFAVLQEIRNAGRPCHVGIIQNYIRNLSELCLPIDSMKHLKEASEQALAASRM